jgi:hypothetical protein
MTFLAVRGVNSLVPNVGQYKAVRISDLIGREKEIVPGVS